MKKRKQDDMEITVSEVVEYMRCTGTFAQALADVLRRRITLDAARKAKIRITAKELQQAADAFRISRGLIKAKDTRKWLKDSGISISAFENFLEENILIDKFKDSVDKKTSKAAKTKMLSNPGIKEALREALYQEWLSKNV